MDTPILLLCGYRKTGKDTFYQKLAVGNEYSYSFYVHPSTRIEHIDNTKQQYHRVSFAESLKQEASQHYGIPANIPDADKDIKQYTHPETQSLVSARDLFIQWGAKRRQEDIDYWTKLAFAKARPAAQYIVTDWRFISESDYTYSNFNRVTTARIYRRQVPIPDLNEKSEHNLDTTLTDVLILSNPGYEETEFMEACKIFPQYKDYILGWQM